MLRPERFVPDKELEREAARLLARARRADLWDGAPPTPVELLVEHVLGLRLGWKYLEPPTDSIVPGWTDPAEKTIYLNEAHRDLFEKTPGLERYTVGHEVGHRVLHVDPASDLQLGLNLVRENQVILCRLGDEGRREFQAERFAALLLMPEDLVRPGAAKLDTRVWRDVYELRDRFEVSATAMKNRLRDLGLPTPLDEVRAVLL